PFAPWMILLAVGALGVVVVLAAVLGRRRRGPPDEPPDAGSNGLAEDAGATLADEGPAAPGAGL
ncbi:MAG: hypothetical protein L3K06_02400, partial [Thermoplasmata archaeon]|nr:hypothetical protein [Thermoplasmata archaeon]